MTTSRLLLASVLLAALASCSIGGDETRTGAGAACVDVGAACADHADCCSYGCMSGICVPNPNEGGACRTTDDCGGVRLCKSGACTTPTVGSCRDDADVCSGWSQCCSGNCEGGSCTQNRAPIASAGSDVPDAPYTRPFTLQNASVDPDGDPLVFGWSFVSIPAGSTATLSSATAANPTFTPDRTGAYVVRLVVTDGPTGAPFRYTVEDTVTIQAVNREPVVTATAEGASWSRNVPLAISATVTDPDGDALECAWRVTEPGAAQPTVLADFAPCANPTSTARAYTAAGEGTYVVEFVVRDQDRATSAVVNAVAAAATFVSTNDPPTPAVSRSPYYANMGAAVGTTPAVLLDASSSTDRNGDHLGAPGLSYFWEMVSASDGGALPALTAFDTATPSFVPPREASYVLRLTVSDPAQFGRPADSASMDVTVVVGRHVQPLGHTVADAARPATLDRIVLAGTDPADATKGMLWVYDMATGTEGTGIRLVDPTDGVSSGIPRLVDVTPDGTKAVVVDEGVSIWIVNLATGQTQSRVLRPFAIGDVVVAGNRSGFLFKSGGDDYLRHLDLTTGAISQPAGAGYSAFGAAGLSGTTDLLYRVDAYWDDWYRYTVNNSGALSQTAYVWGAAPSCGSGYPTQPASAIWGTLTGSYVVSSCGNVYNGTTLADLGTPLGVSPTHVDSTTGGAILACAGTTLHRFGSTLQPAGTDALPRWSQDGYGRTATASRAFLDGAGTRRFAVVRDTATPPRHGIVTFP